MFLPPAERNMRTFLSMLMVLIVSGDDETITGVLKGSVLLPCNCSGINFNKDFKWQKEQPNKMPVFNNVSKFNGTYEHRGKTFLNETNNNCSILLTNITADDQGEYSCRFYYKEQYRKRNVYLNIAASYSLCNNSNNLNGDFQCDVIGRYGDPEIQWNLDGEILTNSSTTNIINSNFMNVSTGRYEFHSKLTTKLKTASEPRPTCHVKAKGISTIISPDCGTAGNYEKSQSHEKNGKPNYKMRYFKVISIMLVLGLCLYLWRRRKSSTSSRRTREAGADNSYC
ncbi:uncharacterized protein LOC123973475 isoform X1 [Micropterus dolomieu]|uniref:uncharacterized protein LOC123973475 isoform X1 n=1 Tax=Micropterus dolomieu TaxID=147949 RepID=UPI001E8CDD8A|nr:uncharacterized protein LOC123973475 isoform X1 [Micropterus dolomieu]